jgi:uncharacterized membrane protein AbrB (regulator of aidB expression)
MSNSPSGGAVNGAVKVSTKIVEAIANPVLIFLIVIVIAVLGSMLYIWRTQRAEGVAAYTHLIDICLPNREKK